MPVKSLTTLCMQTILRNINLVSSVGTELPHDNPHVQKILSKVASAHQLHEIELNSPQLQGHTEKFWKELIRRHFPSSRKKNYVPSDPSGWYKVYKRHKKEDDESLEAANAALKSAFNDIAAEKEKNVSLLINRSQLPKPPRTGRALRTPRGDLQTNNTSSLTFNAGSRTKLTSGKNVLKRARREAMDVAAQRGPLGKQTGASSSQLKAAPPSFLERNRVAAQPAIRVPSKPSTAKLGPAVKRQFSPPDGAKSDEPEPIIVSVSDEEDSDPLFGGADDQGPPTKRPRLGPKQSGRPPKDPLFDSDGEESADAKEPAAKSTVAKGKAVASSQPKPLKRKAGALLPGKPGAGHFLSHSSTAPSSKVTLSQKPSSAKPSSAVDAGSNVRAAPKVGKAPSPPAVKPSQAPETGKKSPVKLAPSADQDSSPKDKPASSAASHPPPMLPRKRKVDIFMKPRKRP
ncbi:hypothetical protein VUR80DRAFT_6486 [Thermomyces stellatus]